MESSSQCMYYISLVCPDPPAGKIRLFQEWMWHHFGCRAAMKSPPHITLMAPFWWPEEKEDELLQVLRDFRFDQDLISIAWNGFGHFGKRVLYVQVADNPELQQLESALSRYLAQNLEGVVSAQRQPFHPHITIATRDMPPGVFQSAWAYFSGKLFSGRFEVHQCSLMKLGPGKWNIAAGYPFIPPRTT